jgi:hypothetical protein
MYAAVAQTLMEAILPALTPVRKETGLPFYPQMSAFRNHQPDW